MEPPKSTARCYTCQTLRPVDDFPYRKNDAIVTPSARLKRLLSILLQRAGANAKVTSNSGAIVRYRCAHPLDGPCPQHITKRRPQRRNLPAPAVEEQTQTRRPGLQERQHSGHLGHEVVVDRVVRPTMDKKVVVLSDHQVNGRSG